MQSKKTPALCKVPFLKKSRKTGQNCNFWKDSNFWQFFWIFPETVVCRDLRFFALHSVHQNPSFELSKSTIQQFFWFFTLRGYVPKTYNSPKNGRKSKTKVFFGQNYKWINNSDGTSCLKGWIKIRISLYGAVLQTPPSLN